MINTSLLSTSIMLVFGIDGHGMCVTQSIIADKVLRKLGHNCKIVAGYHAMVIPDEKTDHFVVHADSRELPGKLEFLIDEPFMNDRNWNHCWVETENEIIDVNLHIRMPKEHTDVKDWNKEDLLNGKIYYMPKVYDIDDEVDNRKIQMVIDTYNQFESNLPLEVNTPEGFILVKERGTWAPVTGSFYKINKNIRPNTKAVVYHPELLKLYE